MNRFLLVLVNWSVQLGGRELLILKTLRILHFFLIFIQNILELLVDIVPEVGLYVVLSFYNILFRYNCAFDMRFHRVIFQTVRWFGRSFYYFFFLLS